MDSDFDSLGMLDTKERHKIEAQFHDEKAKQPPRDFYSFGALDEADEYLWAALGDLRGKALLEIGCGYGLMSVRFAQAGARVTSIDISSEMVELAKGKAREAGLGNSVLVQQMGGEDIDFPEGSFDVVYGHSVLHHLNLDIAVPKIARVLRTGGICAFLEPLSHNPFLNIFRSMTPQRRTPTEKPLTFQQIVVMSHSFSSFDHHEFNLFSLISFFWYYGIRNETLFRRTSHLLQVVDRFVFSHVPILRRFAWVSVLTFRK